MGGPHQPISRTNSELFFKAQNDYVTVPPTYIKICFKTEVEYCVIQRVQGAP